MSRGSRLGSLGVLLLLACGSETGEVPEACEPNRVESCTCSDGRTGTRTCERWGVWAACNCDPAPSPGCLPPAERCGATCTVLDTDPEHCGRCDHRCAEGELCLSGSCEQVDAGGFFDTGSRDSGAPDTGSRDVGTADTGARDSGLVDTGARDTGVMDTGLPDTGVCSMRPLGSSLGDRVVSGTTEGVTNSLEGTCGGATAPELALSWTAPSSGMFTFDTRGSTLDTVLYARDRSCGGRELACDDDGGGGTASSLTLTLSAGQGVVLVVDGYGTQEGAFTLNIYAGGPRDAGTPDSGPPDPCGAVTVEGRCVSASQYQRCEVAATTGARTLRTVNCAASEQCAVGADGYVACTLRPGACYEGATRCGSVTQLQTCRAGAWVSSTCASRCIDTDLGASCGGATGATRTYQGRLLYQTRGPNSTRTAWNTTYTAVPAKGFRVLSYHGSTLLAATSTGDDGSFSIAIPSTPDATDFLSFMAFGTDASGRVAFMVADPGWTSWDPGTPPTTTPTGCTRPIPGALVCNQTETTTGGAAVPSNPHVWMWSQYVRSLPPDGGSLQLNAPQSGPARLFDWLRYVWRSNTTTFGREGSAVIAWLGFNVRWSCGACAARVAYPYNARLAGAFTSQVWFSAGPEEAYWSDSTTGHEYAHWVMGEFGESPAEGGGHSYSVPTFPGMAWSEGWASWYTSYIRNDPYYVTVWGSIRDGRIAQTYGWWNLAERSDGMISDGRTWGHPAGTAWPRPTPSGGLLQRVAENEVSSMLWTLSQGGAGGAPLLRALNSRRMTVGPYERGNTIHTWSVRSDGYTIDESTVRDLGRSRPCFADFLDALVCSGFDRALVDRATEPRTRYPYSASTAPVTTPRCR